MVNSSTAGIAAAMAKALEEQREEGSGSFPGMSSLASVVRMSGSMIKVGRKYHDSRRWNKARRDAGCSGVSKRATLPCFVLCSDPMRRRAAPCATVSAFSCARPGLLSILPM